MGTVVNLVPKVGQARCRTVVRACTGTWEECRKGCSAGQEKWRGAGWGGVGRGAGAVAARALCAVAGGLEPPAEGRGLLGGNDRLRAGRAEGLQERAGGAQEVIPPKQASALGRGFEAHR